MLKYLCSPSSGCSLTSDRSPSSSPPPPGISWECAQVITSCLSLTRRGTFPFKHTWLCGVFVYMKIHAAIKFDFAIFLWFLSPRFEGFEDVQMVAFNSLLRDVLRVSWSLNGKANFVTIERNCNIQGPLFLSLEHSLFTQQINAYCVLGSPTTAVRSTQSPCFMVSLLQRVLVSMLHKLLWRQWQAYSQANEAEADLIHGEEGSFRVSKIWVRI